MPRRRVLPIAAALLHAGLGAVAFAAAPADDAVLLLRRLDDAAARLGALDARQPLNVTTTPSKTGLTSRKTCWYEIAGEWSRLSGEDCVRVDVGTGRMNP